MAEENNKCIRCGGHEFAKWYYPVKSCDVYICSGCDSVYILDVSTGKMVVQNYYIGLAKGIDRF